MLVEALGGKFELASKEGEGTCVRIQLPRSAPERTPSSVSSPIRSSTTGAWPRLIRSTVDRCCSSLTPAGVFKFRIGDFPPRKIVP